MSRITRKQKALLHVAKAQLGLDDESYRTMLGSIAGVRSSTKLTPSKFREVMDHLKRCGFEKTHREHEFAGYAARLHHWQGTAGTRPGMATSAQLARIETDWDGMRWYWAPEGFGNYALSLRGFLKSQAGVSDLRFLTFVQAHNVIEAVKAINKRREYIADIDTCNLTMYL